MFGASTKARVTKGKCVLQKQGGGRREGVALKHPIGHYLDSGLIGTLLRTLASPKKRGPALKRRLHCTNGPGPQ